MYMYMYMYMYMCMFINVYTCTHTHTRDHMYMHTRTNTRTQVAHSMLRSSDLHALIGWIELFCVLFPHQCRPAALAFSLGCKHAHVHQLHAYIYIYMYEGHMLYIHGAAQHPTEIEIVFNIYIYKIFHIYVSIIVQKQ